MRILLALVLLVAAPAAAHAATVDVRIVKTGPSALVAGQTITWTLDLTQRTPGIDARAARVTDAVPVAVTNVAWSCVATGAGNACPAPAAGTAPTGSLNVLVPSLRSGGRVRLTVTGTVGIAGLVSPLVNEATATVSGTDTDSNPADNVSRRSTRVTFVDAIDDSASTLAGSSVVVGVLANDAGTPNRSSLTLVSQPAGATASANPSAGTVTVTPPAAAPPGSVVARYRVCTATRGTRQCDEADLTVGVVAVDAIDDESIATAGAVATAPVLANDLGTIEPSTLAVVSAPAGWIVAPLAWELALVPPASALSGPASVSYRVCTATADPRRCDTATLVVNVRAVAAVDDVATGIAGSTLSIDVLANDAGNIDPASVALVSVAAGIGATADATGHIAVTSGPATAAGAYVVRYRVCTAAAAPAHCDEADLTVSLDAFTDARDDATSVAAGGIGSAVEVLVNDAGSLAPASVRVIAKPTGLSATAPGDGTVLVSAPADEPAGVSEVRYEVCSATTVPRVCDEATIAVTVESAPIALATAAVTPAQIEQSSLAPIAVGPLAPIAGTTPVRLAAPATSTARTRLRVTTRPDHRSVSAGGFIRYAITVRNAGTGSARGVKVCQRLATATSLMWARQARVRAGAACFALGTMRAGATRTVRLTVRATAQRDAHRVRATARAVATNAAARTSTSRWTLVAQGTVGPAARTLRKS
jgi:uncharacterized repeat protein (TIGR01451 family)